MKKIDTHQHLLYPEQFNYSWTKDFPVLGGAFTLEDYRNQAKGCDIEGTVFMEVDVDAEDIAAEGQFFGSLAGDSSSQILGIIASCRPEEADFEAQIEAVQSPALRGIRRVLHTHPDELSHSIGFRANMAKLARMGLTADLCVSQQQHGSALELIQACPDTRFILDHCGCPDIAKHPTSDTEGFQNWKAGIHRLAKQENLICKLSGITAYAKPEQRTKAGLAPYVTEILESFGPQRMVWGGDWPVCNLADGLKKWCQLTDELIADLSADEQSQILYINAQTFYSL
ncbi:MAG: amidohydrolase [Verrucomicrobiota bacterium]